MPVKMIVAVVAVLLGSTVHHAYAQAGSGASAPATVSGPTTSADTSRTSTLGDASLKHSTRPRRVRPVPSTQNGAAPDRASAAGGGR